MVKPEGPGLVYPGPTKNRLFAVFDGFAGCRTCAAAQNSACRSTDRCANRTRRRQTDACTDDCSGSCTRCKAGDVLTNVAGTISVILSAKAVEDFDDRLRIRNVVYG